MLQPEAWFRIVEHDYTQLIAAIDWEEVFQKQRADFQLLDIGCGTGRFPKMLQSSIAVATLRIQYDYLDPSHYCLAHLPTGSETTVSPTARLSNHPGTCPGGPHLRNL